MRIATAENWQSSSLANEAGNVALFRAAEKGPENKEELREVVHGS